MPHLLLLSIDIANLIKESVNIPDYSVEFVRGVFIKQRCILHSLFFLDACFVQGLHHQVSKFKRTVVGIELLGIINELAVKGM